MENINQHKKLILSFYKEVIANRNTELAKEIIAEDYIQHNPTLKTGISGILEAIAFLKQLPDKKVSQSPIKRIICDQNFVATHLLVEMGNTKQLVIDLFRIQEGKIQEHWDAIESYPGETERVDNLVDGPSEIRDQYLTQENKRIVLDFIQMVWAKKNLSLLSDFLHPTFIYHHTDVKAGLSGFQQFLAQAGGINVQTIHRVIGEGNFVLTQLEGSDGERRTVHYQLYHLEGSKISDCWTVSQEFPDKMAHSNGMI
ncbi:MAG: ester cyclase [Bacteroidota bacterium]